MLEVRDLSVSHGLAQAVRGVSLDVPAGVVVVVIGANGAGKSSLLEGISGIKRPVGGRVTFRGERIETLPAHAVLARGIAHVPEDRLIFTRLTVGENLMVGAGPGVRAKEARQRLDSVLTRFPELAGRLGERASALSGGQRQLLAVARGLMARPKLLILDEPSLGLSPRATVDMFGLVADLRAGGQSVLVVDQNIDRALAIADYAYAIVGGEVAFAGPAKELADDPRVADACLGVADKRRTA